MRCIRCIAMRALAGRVRSAHRQLIPRRRLARPVRAMAAATPLIFADRQRCAAQLLLGEVAAAGLAAATPIFLVQPGGLEGALAGAGAAAAAWVAVNKYTAVRGEVLLLPDASSGGVASVLLGVGEQPTPDPWLVAALPGKLPPGTYAFAPTSSEGLAGNGAADRALLGWMLGCYKFTRFKTGKLDKAGSSGAPLLVVPQGADAAAVSALAEAFVWCRDLINTPADDLGPQQLAAEAAALAAAHPGAQLAVIEGDELLAAGYPAIHTVGRAAARAPLLVDLSWAPPSSTSGSGSGASLPLVALVGKGVCFDSGGLDIKTAQGMRLMKKDMGGAALVLALAHVIMAAQLPVRLRVLVPAVENAISGNAYRPGDVLRTRAGLTVENGNTDAEGRLILCDALFEAGAGAGGPPDVLIDAATLTGAARVALGPELPAVFSSSDDAWHQLEAAAQQEGDPLWRLPLWHGYRKQLDSKVADLSSTGEPGQAGAITAALFLQQFVSLAAPQTPWLHVDTAGWVSGGGAGPGRPEGGEALGLRALWRFLCNRYASNA